MFGRLIKLLQFALLPTALMISLIALVVKADNQFIVEYDLTYNITSIGETQVDQTVTLTNLQKDVVATSYSLLIKKLSVYDVYGHDLEGQMKTNVEKTDDNTSISAQLNKQIIGEGKQNRFTVTYKTKDIAKKVGNIWNINIPKAEITTAASRYNITIAVPKEIGPNIFISPIPDTTKDDGNVYIYTFSKEKVQNTGITAAFGLHQDLNFNLTYELQNQAKIPQTFEIALPFDKKNVQQVSYASITPEPYFVYFDEDNNYIARYILKPSQAIEVKALGSARLFSKQIDLNASKNFADLPDELVKKYTNAQPFWESDSQQIQEIAAQLKDENVSVAQNAKKAYDYVVHTLDYDFEINSRETVERHGAKTALTQDSPNVCMEFTDAFIAITRAMGIPSRELNGYAFTTDIENKPLSINLSGIDLLHAWPEFYDPTYGWVSVDPTWGKTAGIDYFTKLDTNHFAFVTKGIDSQWPIPAGGYRNTNINSPEKDAPIAKKLVEVEFAQNNIEDKFDNKLKIYNTPNLNLYQIFKGRKAYILTNEGGTFLYNIQTANSTVSILKPNRKIKVYFDRDTTKIEFKDANDTPLEIPFIITQQKIPKIIDNESNTLFIASKVFVVFLVGLLLYVSIYNLAMLLSHLKKLVHHLYLRLRDRDR